LTPRSFGDARGVMCRKMGDGDRTICESMTSTDGEMVNEEFCETSREVGMEVAG
jgi:hypothetical protein